MKQQGYAMMLFLPTLLAVMLSMSMAVAPINTTVVQQQQQLDEAAQRLVTYAATYLESYKPTGAGPGHLPCPDTDWHHDSYQVNMGLHGDGPNPPCGRSAIAIGKLPRHISHGKHRYAFHLEDKHNIWYAVDTRFINNPTNRVVNPNTVGRIRIGSNAPVAAMVFFIDESARVWRQSMLATLSEEHIAAIKQYKLISVASLMEAVTFRVEHWMQNRYQEIGFFNCASDSTCHYRDLEPCDIPLRDKLLLLMVERAHTAPCDSTTAGGDWLNQYWQDARLDTVPLRRHWFIRNDWWRFVSVKIDSRCESGVADCYTLVATEADLKSITLSVSVL